LTKRVSIRLLWHRKENVGQQYRVYGNIDQIATRYVPNGLYEVFQSAFEKNYNNIK